MDKPVLYSSNMEFEQEHWKGELAFWKGELITFNNRLSELISRWTPKDELDQIKHYQKKFIFHGDAIEELLETLEQEIPMEVKVATSIQKLDAHSSQQHTELRNRMEKQREIYSELKKIIFKFLER